jgi:N-acetylglucosaminyldiphosphoundecaprenol N-acetyl-beta-D-mannosaminyltransferase
MKTIRVLKTNIADTTINEVSQLLNTSNNKTIAICNANTLVQSYKDEKLNSIINSFSVATPDGFPVAKAISRLAKKNIPRVDGFKVFKETIKNGIEINTSHYFFGNNEKVVNLMIKNLKKEFPNINISGFACPPFENVENLITRFKENVSNDNPDVVWVSLGFPKQEIFIFKLLESTSINSNFVGVGAVFEWVAGTKIKAPEWVANIGLEWVLRLIQEPRRLLRRYLIDNTLFVYYFYKQLMSKN